MDNTQQTKKPAYLAWLESVAVGYDDGKSPNGVGTRWQSTGQHAQAEHERNEYLKYGHGDKKS